MKTYSVKAYAKINLSIDVLGKRVDGYHEVRMVMQQVDLWDRVTVSMEEGIAAGGNTAETPAIKLTTDREDLPCDSSNLAWRAAALLVNKYADIGSISIHLEKRIPVAAGLAGGSADAAAVLHAINRLLGSPLLLGELMELGLKLGADVPFCLMGQAAAEPHLGFAPEGLSTCAEATGIGERLRPLPPLCAWVLLSKPPVFVSTKEVYEAWDLSITEQRPNTDELIRNLYAKNTVEMYKNMCNVLEKISEVRYPVIVYTKNKMDTGDENIKVMMSGSGPTVFALSDKRSRLDPICEEMKKRNAETYLVETISLRKEAAQREERTC